MKNVFKKIIVWILKLEARIVLWKYKPRVVGVTGSVGKTSAKDAIYTVLGSTFYVRKSAKSFNSEFGVSLTILGCDTGWNNPLLWIKNILQGLVLIVLPTHYPKWLVLEVGLDAPGDITKVVSWLQLDAAVFTRLAATPVHVEFFSSVKALHDEKKKLARGLDEHGTLVLNADDELLTDVRHPHGGRSITYSIDGQADVIASNVSTHYSDGRPIGITFKISYQGRVIPVRIDGVLGVQHVYPVLAAAAVGVSQDMNLVAIGSAFSKHTPPRGRMCLLDGVHDAVLIDDTYNSSPVAARAALDVLAPLEGAGRKIAVLGDMMELGEHTAAKHKEIGAYAAGIVDMLVCVGVRGAYIAEAARKAGMKEVYEYKNAEEAGEAVRALLREGDYVLIKGSQSVRLEKATTQLLRDPSRANEFLVRQDTAWHRR